MTIEQKLRQAIAATKLAVRKSRGEAKSAGWGPLDDLEILHQLKAELKILGSLESGPLFDLLGTGGSFRLMGLNRQVAAYSVRRKCSVLFVFRGQKPEKSFVIFSGSKAGMRKLVAYLTYCLSRSCDEVTNRTKFRVRHASAQRAKKNSTIPSEFL